MKVYLYNPGMLHAKGMIIDDNLVTAGERRGLKSVLQRVGGEEVRSLDIDALCSG